MKKNDFSIPQDNYHDAISKWSEALHHLKKFCEIVDPDESDSVYKNFVQAILQKKFMSTLSSQYNYISYNNANSPRDKVSKSPSFPQRQNFYPNPNQFTFSRFESEFIVIKNVFENSNSSVYQAINKLDGCIYAIKKIQQPIIGSDLELIIQEARIMPNLVHPNLIRYNTSWVEFQITGEPDNAIVVESKSSIDSLIKNFGSQPEKETLYLKGSMPLSITFDKTVNDDIDNDDENTEGENKKDDSNNNNDDDKNDNDEKNKDDDNENDNDDENKNEEEEEANNNENDNEEKNNEIEEEDNNENDHDEENINEEEEEENSDNQNDDEIENEGSSFCTFSNNSNSFDYNNESPSFSFTEHTYTETTKTDNCTVAKVNTSRSCFMLEEQTGTKTLNDTDYSDYDDEGDSNANPVDFVFYLQMELCLETPFSDFMKPLDLYSRLEKLLHVCYGLQYLHKAGIIHRDLKPSNILIGNDEEPKLADFGISIYAARPSLHAMEYMTALYASPEHNDPTKISTKSDIFSLALIFVQVLGNYKTKMEEMLSMSNLKKFGNLPKYFMSENEFPRNITDLIIKMAKEDPNERPEIDEVINEIKDTIEKKKEK